MLGGRSPTGLILNAVIDFIPLKQLPGNLRSDQMERNCKPVKKGGKWDDHTSE